MEFKQFKELMQQHVATLLLGQETLFVANIEPDKLWELYLDSFPPGTNEVYRERREFDCSCCRHFIRALGNVVVIIGNEVKTIWDFETGEDVFHVVINALDSAVKNAGIKDVFITTEQNIGTDFNRELLDNGVQRWEHFYIKLPKNFVTASSKSVGALQGEARDTKNVFKRSLDELSQEAVEAVLELISQKNLYKGEEWQGVLSKFLEYHCEYHALDEAYRDVYCWGTSKKAGGAVGRIRKHSIGTLLTDLSAGMDINEAVKRYEKIVAPSNYKRPKTIFTQKMVDQARQKIEELGLLDSLGRRHATLHDITANNILYANRNVAPHLASDVFGELKKGAKSAPKSFDKLSEVSIDHFVAEVLPKAKNLEVLFENRHIPSLVSLIAPAVPESKPMFKWNNGFSWAYHGNITDSMKERVKAMGGKVDGPLRFSIQWNDGEEHNPNDFDAHCLEPDGNHIYFPNKREIHRSTGMLDVDIQYPDRGKPAVENITWSDTRKMQKGNYSLHVHNFAHRGGRSGFKAEIEFNGQIFSFDYPKELRQDERVPVAVVNFDGETFNIVSSLPSNVSSIDAWGLKTNEFHPVTVCMFSPNYWDAQSGIGHRHYFFMLQNCVNDTQPNGFFNEFLREDLMEHKRVFEALGSQMRVPLSDRQLSGIGFSATKRNHLICRVEGYTKSMVKVTF